MRLCLKLLQRSEPTARAGGGLFRRGINKLFGEYLVATNTVTSGILMGVGDAIQQELEFYRGEHEKQRYRYDWPRINRMFIVGLVTGAPQHYFYGYIDRILPRRDFGSVTKKVLLDQFVASPICIVMFFAGMGWLEGHSNNEVFLELQQKFIIVYKMDWLIWPPAQYINFYWVSPAYRVLYVNFMTMLYNIFLSYAKHDIPTKIDQEQKL